MPFYPFWGEGAPTKIDKSEKVGTIILSTGGPRQRLPSPQTSASGDGGPLAEALSARAFGAQGAGRAQRAQRARGGSQGPGKEVRTIFCT